MYCNLLHTLCCLRDFAQLRLAEQILAERETDLHLVETKAERERVEKEQMVEEMAAMKSALNSSIIEPQDSPQSSRVSCVGAMPLLAPSLYTHTHTVHVYCTDNKTISLYS